MLELSSFFLWSLVPWGLSANFSQNVCHLIPLFWWLTCARITPLLFPHYYQDASLQIFLHSAIQQHLFPAFSWLNKLVSIPAMWVFPPGPYSSWLIILFLFKDIQLCQIVPHAFCINTQASEMFRNAVCSRPFLFFLRCCFPPFCYSCPSSKSALLTLTSPTCSQLSSFLSQDAVFLWNETDPFSSHIFFWDPLNKVSCAWNYCEDVSVYVAIKKPKHY